MTSPNQKTDDRPPAFDEEDVRYLSACCWDYLTMMTKAAQDHEKGATQTFARKAMTAVQLKSKVLKTMDAGDAGDAGIKRAEDAVAMVNYALEKAAEALDGDNFLKVELHLDEARTIIEHYLGIQPPVMEARRRGGAQGRAGTPKRGY